jgi:hypothetical protein
MTDVASEADGGDFWTTGGCRPFSDLYIYLLRKKNNLSDLRKKQQSV